MRPPSKNHHRRHKPQVKPTYTVSELAELAQQSDDWVRGELRNAGLLPPGPGKRGKKAVIYLCDLKQKLPKLFSSVQIAESFGSSG